MKFEIIVERLYTLREAAEITVDAESPEHALELAKQQEYDDGITDWHETDGYADPDSYSWTVRRPDGRTLKGEGTND